MDAEKEGSEVLDYSQEMARLPLSERGEVLVRRKNLAGEVVADPGSRARDLQAKEALWKRYLKDIGDSEAGHEGGDR